ncbi:MAG: transporter, partial [Bacteroidetes bacterium]|nr:transporter [Bacteroidota bacterium]
PELTYRGILKYELNNNFYIRGAGAYIWRGYTEAERVYYYNNGSYYTAWMDVPSAWEYQAVLGKWFFSRSLRTELSFTGLKSTSGDDIRPYNAPQPTNKVNFDQIGILIQYYIPSIDGLGIVVSHTRTLNGLNTGKVNTSGIGITYFFNYLKKTENDN